MCRHSFSGPYKHHFLCFRCREAFKQPPIEDFLTLRGHGHAYREIVRHLPNKGAMARCETALGLTLASLQAEFRAAERKCPECDEPMADLGLDVKPPRRNDVRAWKKLHGLYRVGHEWRSCGCNGPGWIPKSNADYREYLHGHLETFNANLRRAQERPGIDAETKKHDGEYWTTRISAIEAELAALKI